MSYDILRKKGVQDMKIFHISDLHIGKQLHYYSLKEEQRSILSQIADKAKEYGPDVILIAGDIYDKSVPSGEAYEILDEFLNNLANIRPSIPVLMIAGNHDNAKRLNYAGTFLEKHNIYISVLPPQDKEEHLKKIVLTDAYGEVSFYLLPFTKPGYVKHLFEEGEVQDYNSAVRAVIEREPIDYSKRNVLLAHQFFVSGGREPEKCDSELTYISVGGIDSVDIDCVRKFDYVALGHIHGEQSIGEPHIRYSGTPMKYSVSEEKHIKGITMITLGEKNSEIKYERIPLTMAQDVRRIEGTLEEVMGQATEENRNDYVSITLTNEESLYRPKDQLEEHYNHILEVRLENRNIRRRLNQTEDTGEHLDPITAFAEFYQLMHNQPISEKETEIMTEIISEVKNAQE